MIGVKKLNLTVSMFIIAEAQHSQLKKGEQLPQLSP